MQGSSPHLFAGGRLLALREKALSEGLDGVLLLPGPNMRYFLGVSTESYERLTIALLSFKGSSSILVPRLDLERVGEQLAVGEMELFSYGDDEDPWLKVASMLSRAGLEKGTVGVEGTMPFKVLTRLRVLGEGLALREIDPVFYELRAVKEEAELAAHRRASAILQEAFMATLADLREGMEEREAAFLFRKRALELGAESVPFCLVQSGPDGAKPHLGPTARRIGRGEPVVFDAGVTYDGYYADVTRTVCLGDPGDEAEKIFEAVLEAQSRALEQVGPGVKAEQLDRAARGVIARRGYAQYFIHRTGHGLGLEVHEEPYIREGSPTILKAGMIFTVEPGIYLPGRFGMRLEDDVVVTKAGCENLTYLPKSLYIGDYL
ncbi:MAG: aminopeptidase P family protein [Nitrososphaerota archaeon]